ncbi:MAG: GtrA family protein [Pseudomonadota bacterium]
MIGRRLSRFTVISGCGWALDVCVLLVLVTLGLDAFSANLIGAFCGVTFVFVMARRQVFEQVGAREGALSGAFLPYLAWQAVAIPAASALVWLLASALAEPAVWVAEGLSSWSTTLAAVMLPAPVLAAGVAKAAVTPLTLYANFLVTAFLIERRFSWR